MSLWLWISLLVLGLLIIIAHEVLRVVRKVNLAMQLGKEVTPFSREDPRATRRILVIGDSTSYGTGTLDPRHSLAGRLGNDKPDHALVNASENAMSLARLVAKLEEVQGSYALTFIHIGGVDTVSFTPLSKIRTQLAQAIKIAKQKTSDRVVIVSVNNAGAVPAYRFPLSNLFSWRSQLVSAAFDEICRQEGATHVPLWERRETDPLWKDPARLMAPDTMHPSGEGYAYWYQKIRQVL